MRSMSGIGRKQLVAVHQVGHELVGELVDRRGAEPVAGPERLDHRGAVGQRAEAVDVGVAEVDAEGVPAVPVDRRRPARPRPGRGPRPSRSPPSRRPPDASPTRRTGRRNRSGSAWTSAMRDALGADVPARQRVVRVAADAGHHAVLEGDARGRRSPRTGCTRRSVVVCITASCHPEVGIEALACPRPPHRGRHNRREDRWDTDSESSCSRWG